MHKVLLYPLIFIIGIAFHSLLIQARMGIYRRNDLNKHARKKQVNKKQNRTK